MIQSVTIRNFRNEEITINLTEAEPAHGLIIEKIDGLGPAQGIINMSDLVTSDGALFNSARLDKRTITFSFILAWAPDIETSRQNLYKYMPIKKPVTLIFNTSYRNLRVTGYVENNEPEIFNKMEKVLVTVLCPDPYFRKGDGPSSINFRTASPEFEFPFENNSLTEPLIEFGNLISRTAVVINYDGDSDVGLIFTLFALRDGLQTFTFYNATTEQAMQFDFSSIGNLNANDRLYVSTDVRDTYVTLYRNAALSNAINTLDRASEWPLVVKGENVFMYRTQSDEMDKYVDVSIEWDPVYEGV